MAHRIKRTINLSLVFIRFELDRIYRIYRILDNLFLTTEGTEGTEQYLLLLTAKAQRALRLYLFLFR